MKKIFLLLTAGVLLASCGGKEETKKEYTTISGKIDNFSSRTMTLIGYNYEKKLRFDRKSGTFTDTLTDIKSGNYILKVGKRPIPLYITPDSKTDFTVDAKKRTEAPVFKGTNGKINAYLTEKTKKFGLILGNANKLFSLNEDEFLSKVDEYKSTLDDLVLSRSSGKDKKSDDLKATFGFDKNFVERETRNINYEFVRNLNNYQGYHRLLYGDDEFVVSDNFPTKLIDETSFNEAEDYVFSRQYRTFLDERLKSIANKRKIEDGDFDLTHLETIQTEVTDTLIKNDLMFNLAQSSITYTEDLGEYYKKFMAYSTNKEHEKIITDSYEKLKLTARGQPSPKFENYENYNGGTTSLDDLTGKGKYVYIDVWATWCGFCKKEIPLLKRFEQQYHGKNIEFVSINVDAKSAKSKWRETIEDKEMGGIQLFAGKKESELQFTKDYLIKGLPRFILIDPEGNIVTANAPRPSDGDKLEEILDALEI